MTPAAETAADHEEEARRVGVALPTWLRVVRDAEPQTYGEVVGELDAAEAGPEDTAAARAVAAAIDDEAGPLTERPDHEDAGVFPVVVVEGGARR